MLKTKEINKKITEMWHNLKENIYFSFSFENKVDCWQFAILILFIHAIFSSFNLFCSFQKLSLIAGLVEFYGIMALIQKRCRDFGSKGTLWILAYSAVFVIAQAFYFIDLSTIERLWRNVSVGARDCQLIILLLLFLIPSKKDADLSLRSPLLKYPFVYVGICWTLAIGATLAVNHYFGI
ncbi:MAG: hypothetical protein IJ852_00595 [Alphaproteobacteria bacterium]|nr:hypothetical protein [Alphaproteobacteria bacterium]